MEPLHEQRKKAILEYILSDEYVPVKSKQLAALICVPTEDRQEFRKIIEELKIENNIMTDERGLIRPQSENIKIGRISITQRGFGFVTVENESDSEDIFIPEPDINGAMQDDKVCVAISGRSSRGRRREGVVVSIVERSITQIVGTLEKQKSFSFVIPDNRRYNSDIFIPKNKTGGAANGQKVLVQINDFGNGKNVSPEGEVIAVIGNPKDKGVRVTSVVMDKGIPCEFPEAVIDEARKLPDKVDSRALAGRKDLRSVLTITIDGEDTKDFDDAVTLSHENGIYTLGVHIADVSHYVKEGSPLDVEAINRGTSVYLADRVIPMLPKELSNGICSLNMGEDRLTLSCIMKLDDSGRIISHEIAESVICVDRRMTYNEVNEFLTDNCAGEKIREVVDPKNSADTSVSGSSTIPDDICRILLVMQELAEKRIEIRKNKGAIDFDFPESKVILDDNGEPVEIRPFERNIATRIIEEFMLAANETVAEDYFWQESPFLYRSHETPDAAKMHELSVFISNFGLRVKTTGEYIHPMEIQKLLASIQGIPEENLISRLTLRSMKRAKYTVDAEGHFGLASRYYTHFTSPIRRYPDLQIHRIIKENLHGGLTEKRIAHYYEILPGIADLSSRYERRAEEAEREVCRIMMAEYMNRHLGDVYEGIISGVTNWGIYVELINTVEGMVRVDDLTDDDYIYEENSFRMAGRCSGKIYALGQKVSVLVLRCDVEAGTVDLLFADEEETD